MKIVLVHGQNHAGSTCTIGRQVAEKITGEKEIKEFFLPRDLEHFCLGCYTCIKDEAKCPFYAEKMRIMSEIELADVLIFTTPTYCLHASAGMKAFLDLTYTYWLPHKPRECMFTKKALAISTAAGSGAKTAAKDISDTFFYWGIPFIRTYALGVQAMNWKGVSEKKKEKIDKKTTQLAKQLSSAKKIRPGINTKFMFGIMRLMQKSGNGSGEAERKYWEEKGWLGKKRPWQA